MHRPTANRSIAPRLLAVAALALLALGLAGCKKDSAAESAPTALATPLPAVPAPAGKAWADQIVATPEGGYRMGNPQAPIKIVEYGSLTCPHCAEFSEKGSATIRDQWVASGRVSYEFRHFVRDGLDLTLGLLTRCGQPETFFALTEQVFANQKPLFESLKGHDAQMQAAMSAPAGQRFLAVAEAANLTPFFAERGVSVDQAKACLSQSATAETMAKQTTEQGDKYQIEGTPTFLVNGDKIGTSTWEEFKVRIEALGVR